MFSKRFRIAPALWVVCLLTSISSAESYLDSLDPVLHIPMLDAPAVTNALPGGHVLFRGEKYLDSMPAQVRGPRPWIPKAWDFSVCKGPFHVKVDERMSRIGNLETNIGFTVSFWFKGQYRGTTSRIMTGPFDIGTGKDNIWGGTADYQNAQSPGRGPLWKQEWHHCVVRVDFREKLNNITLFIDGKVSGERSGAYTKNLNTALGRFWNFGARHASDDGFDFGALADISVYDRPLEINEVGYLFSGPGYAGADQEIAMPNMAQLQGFPIPGRVVGWRQTAGPEAARIEFRNKSNTRVKFAAAGEYKFQMASGNSRDEVVIQVISNVPPQVSAGSGITLASTGDSFQLQGSIIDDSIVRGKALKSRWSVVDAPSGGRCTFSDGASPSSFAHFTGRGLYTLRLEATDGELVTHADVNVLVNPDSKPSYLQLLDPLMLLDFDRPAEGGADAMTDAKGKVGYKIRRPENGVPTMIKGARPFTGYGWDFSISDTDVEVINGIHLLPLHDREQSARSMSLWIRCDQETTSNITSFLGLLSIHPGYGLSYGVNGVATIAYKAGREMMDGEWHHVAVNLECGEDSVTQTLFVDGEEAATESKPYPSAFWQPSSRAIRHPLYVGSRGRSGKDNFVGMIDDFAVFDRALTLDEIRFIMNGPAQNDKAILSRLDQVEIDAGKNQFIPLPASYEVDLAGKCSSLAGLTPRWTVAHGAGEVEFANENSPNTKATFKPVKTDKDGEYSKYILKLSLENSTGHAVMSDTVTVLFYPDRAPAPRSVSATPEVGVHPRVFCSPEDLPELRRKVLEVPIAIKALDALKNSSEKLFNPHDPMGSLYAGFLKGDDVSIRPYYDMTGGQASFFIQMAHAATVAWIGENDTSNDTRLNDMGTVLGLLCSEMLTWYVPNHGNALCHDIDAGLGMSYDLLYNYMNDHDRAVVRRLLARMTRYRQSVGTDQVPYVNATNWAGHHDHAFIALLAIEGEEGYDEAVVENAELKKSIFLTQYGVFDSGLPHEGYAYYTFGMTWHAYSDYAISRRENRENLAVTTRFYKSIEAAFRLLDPDGSGIRSHHDVVGDEDGIGLLGVPPRQVIMAKYLWPEDRMVDYVYRDLLPNLMDAEDRYFDLYHVLFGEEVTYPDQSLAEAAGDRPATQFCPDRGFMMARDAWDPEAIRFDFRSRMDKYWLGHQHADINSFELWSHQRLWIGDRGKFATTINDMHSTILVDGIGACSSKRNAWPSGPGKFVSFEESDAAVIGAADAATFYRYSKGKPNSAPQELIKDHGLMWSDFYYTREGETMPAWMGFTPIGIDGYGNAAGMWEMNPMKKALRSTALVKGSHPFVVIVDDYQKDEAPHDYLWIAHTMINDQVEVESSDKTSLVLRHTREPLSGPRLLVQVLNADGQSGPITLSTDPIKSGAETLTSSRIEIPCSNTVNPNYHVLLYPYTLGEAKPTVTPLEDGGGYALEINGEITKVVLTRDDEGRQHIEAAVFD